jgi:hypothetical protein
MANSDRLVNELQIKLVGSTLNMIRLEVWNMLDDFCREGLAWRETISVTPVVDQLDYVITPAGTEIVRVYSVDHDTLDLTGVVYEFGTLSLQTAPTADDIAQPLYVATSLAPAITQGADIENMVPVDMWSKFHRTFVKGVLGLAMAQPAKPYSNPQLAAFYWRGYLSDRAVARREAETGGYRGAQLWSFPRFGR